MPSERAVKLASTIASRHQREAQGLSDALGVDAIAAETITLVAVFTMGRIMGMMQTLDVLKETGE